MSTLLTCDVTRLEDFLLGELTERAEADLIDHLDSCEQCRARLDETAGGADWRQEVGTILAVDPLAEEMSTIAAGDTSCELSPRDASGLVEQTRFALQSVLGPTDDPAMLGRISSYEVAGVVGRGATGIVVKAFEASLNRFVAIKLLSPELAANDAARRRFAREAQAAAAVVNEHVVPIYAVDEYRGSPFLVMHFVSGGSLEHRLRQAGVLPLDAVLRIGMQIASGLAAAHAQGLIHRDIKPANILLDHGVERVLITDFGLARAGDDATLTHSGFVAGTPQFMSPEQARGEVIDHRTDLFSLGAVLYMLISGRPPFRAETAYGILRRICDEPHRPLCEVTRSTPRWASDLVDLFLMKDPQDRIRSAPEAALLLSGCLAHVQNPSTCPLPRELRDTPARRLARASRRPRVRAGAFSLVLAAVCGWWTLDRPRPPVVVQPVSFLEDIPFAGDPVTISWMSPRPAGIIRLEFAAADELESELSALDRDILAYERKVGQRGVEVSDAWRLEFLETLSRMRLLEDEAPAEHSSRPTRNSTSPPPHWTVEVFAPPMANTRPTPAAPDYGTTL